LADLQFVQGPASGVESQSLTTFFVMRQFMHSMRRAANTSPDQPPSSRSYLFPPSAQFGIDNLVLHARAKRHKVTDFAGPLSIKTVVEGRVVWKVDGRDLEVDSSSLLVLGDGQRYSMDVNIPAPVETACIFFRSGFVEAVAQDITTPVEASLDDPQRVGPPLPYILRLHVDSVSSVIQRTQSLARRCSEDLQPSGFEQDFLELSKDVLLIYDEVRRQMARVPAAKHSTREELLRRLERGREYIHSHAEGKLSLDDVAKAACLSHYHFHRLFSRVFQQTPHAYITDIRMTRAYTLLLSGLSVNEVCEAVGFTSTSSFGRRFRARYQVAPGAVYKR
jgi:AraC family transcriptional regulator